MVAKIRQRVHAKNPEVQVSRTFSHGTGLTVRSKFLREVLHLSETSFRCSKSPVAYRSVLPSDFVEASEKATLDSTEFHGRLLFV